MANGGANRTGWSRRTSDSISDMHRRLVVEGGQDRRTQASADLHSPTMTMTRRDAVASLALLADVVGFGQLAEAQTQSTPPSTRPPVFTHYLPNATLDGWEVTVNDVDYPPGPRVCVVHHHAGFALVYVLEGAVIAKILRTRRREDVHDRPSSTSWDEVSKNASQTKPAQLLAMIFAKKGATLTTSGRAD